MTDILSRATASLVGTTEWPWVAELVEYADSLRAENERLREALREFADQPLIAEMPEHIRFIADLEHAYEEFIRVSRALLGGTKEGG